MQRPTSEPLLPSAVLENLTWVRALARSVASTSAAADDLAQETWRRALENPAPKGLPLRAWLGGILRRTAADQRRSEARRRHREKQAARPEAVPSNSELTARLEQSREMADLAMELEEPYRRIVLLRYFEGLGPQAIAEQESLPLATVKTRLRRALEKLRREVDTRHSLGSHAWLLVLAGQSASPTVVPVFAALAMKSYALIITAVLLVLGGGLWWTRSTQTTSLETPSVAPVAAFETPGVPLPASPESAAPESTSARSEATSSLAAVEPSAATLSVTAIDARTEQPLANADLWVVPYADIPGKLHRGFNPEPFAVEHGAFGALVEGSARILRPAAYSLLIARSGDLYGTMYLHSETAEEIVVRLALDRTLQVQVVDAEGQPVEGVGVVLQEGLEDSRRFVIESDTMGPEGIATLAHLDTVLPPDTRQGKLYNLAFASLVKHQPLLPFDPDAALDGPIVLELLPTGSMVFEMLDADGMEFDYTGHLYVAAVESDGSGGKQSGPRHHSYMEKASRLDVAGVGLDMELVVEATPIGQLRPVKLRVEGPSKEGEKVTVSLVLSGAFPAFKGRLVPKDGTPRVGPPATSWPATLEVLDGPEGGDVAPIKERATLTADGSFLLPVTHALAQGTTCRVRILQRQHQARNTPLYAEFVAAIPGDGQAVDVGRLDFVEMPLVAAGRVVDSAGRPLVGADIQVAGKMSLGSSTPGFKWGFLGMGSSYTGSEGEFEVRGFQPNGEYALRPRMRGFQGRGFIPFQHGDQGIELVLDRPSSLSGAVLVSEDIPLDRLNVALRYHGADPKAEFYDRKVLPLGFGGEFQFQDLRPGTIDLIVRTGPLAEPLHIQAEIKLAPGAAGDNARLEPIDLRGKLRMIDVLAQGDGGDPVERGYVTLGTRNYQLLAGRARIIGKAGPTDLMIQAPGYLPLESAARDGATIVQLERTIPVSITVGTSLPEAPPGTQVLLGLSPRFGEREGLVVFDENDEEQVWSTRWLGVEYQRIDGAASTVLHVPLPGEYRLQWMVMEARSPGFGSGQWWISDLNQQVEVGSEGMHLRIEPNVDTFEAGLTR